MAKRFKCDDPSEYRSYAIADVSKSDKTIKDFLDENEEVYDIIAFNDYLWEKGCYMTGEEVENQLNELYEENQQLKQENQRTKEAIYFLIECEASHTTNKEEEMEALCQNIFNCSHKEAKKKYGTVSEVLLK